MSYEILRGEFMKVKLSQRYIYKNYDWMLSVLWYVMGHLYALKLPKPYVFDVQLCSQLLGTKPTERLLCLYIFYFYNLALYV